MTASPRNSDSAGKNAIGRRRMPPEWHPHAACWMAWPSHTVVSGERRHEVIRKLGAIAHAIARFEPLHVAVDPAHMDEALRLLPISTTLHLMPVDDHWMRDTGPTFVFDDAMALHADIAGDPDFAPVYVNFYLPNEGVVIASFGDPGADTHAHDIVKQAFPDGHVVQLPLRGIARRGGGIHCCTRQQPAAAQP